MRGEGIGLATRALVLVLASSVLTLGGATPARAQGLADYDYENLTFRGVGVDLGYVWPSKVEATNSYHLTLDLGFLGPGVRIAAGIGYWSSRMKPGELDRLARQLDRLPALQGRGVSVSGEELAPIDWSDLNLDVAADYVWRTPVELYPYVGLRLGLHALNGQGPAIDNTFVEDLLDSISPSAGAVVGLEYPLIERLRLSAEADYTLMTDLHYPGVRVGFTLMLPPRGTSGSGGAAAGTHR